MASNNIQPVKAIDIEANSVVECDPSDVVEIEAVRQAVCPYGGDGVPVTPATERIFSRRIATKLTKIYPAEFNMRRPWPLVEYRCDRHTVYCNGKKTFSLKSRCFIRNEADVRDPLFKLLSSAERNSMMDALKAFVEESRHG